MTECCIITALSHFLIFTLVIHIVNLITHCITILKSDAYAYIIIV